MNLGAPELLIILIVVLVLFGSAKLPKLARSLGLAQSEFKKGLSIGASGEPVQDERAAGDEKISMTRTELDALLAERERAAREEQSRPS